MADVTEKLSPGGEVPWGECEQCGAFLYLDEIESRPRKGEIVRECQPPYQAINRQALF